MAVMAALLAWPDAHRRGPDLARLRPRCRPRRRRGGRQPGTAVVRHRGRRGRPTCAARSAWCRPRSSSARCSDRYSAASSSASSDPAGRSPSTPLTYLGPLDRARDDAAAGPCTGRCRAPRRFRAAGRAAVCGVAPEGALADGDGRHLRVLHVSLPVTLAAFAKNDFHSGRDGRGSPQRRRRRRRARWRPADRTPAQRRCGYGRILRPPPCWRRPRSSRPSARRQVALTVLIVLVGAANLAS